MNEQIKDDTVQLARARTQLQFSVLMYLRREVKNLSAKYPNRTVTFVSTGREPVLYIQRHCPGKAPFTLKPKEACGRVVPPPFLDEIPEIEKIADIGGLIAPICISFRGGKLVRVLQ